MRTGKSNDPAGNARMLSWLFLAGLFLVCAVGQGLYAAHGLPPSGRYQLITRLATISFVWHWLREQCKPWRVAFPLDMGIFVAAASVVVVPYYLWKCERWMGMAKVAAVVGLHLAAYALSLLTYYGTTWLQGQ